HDPALGKPTGPQRVRDEPDEQTIRCTAAHRGYPVPFPAGTPQHKRRHRQVGVRDGGCDRVTGIGFGRATAASKSVSTVSGSAHPRSGPVTTVSGFAHPSSGSVTVAWRFPVRGGVACLARLAADHSRTPHPGTGRIGG